jgi:cellobiose transport system permease protein
MSSITTEPDGVKPPTDRSRTQLPLTWRQRRGRWDVKYSPYLYILPFFLVFAITGLFPILYTAFISVQNWDHIRGTGTFVGL